MGWTRLLSALLIVGVVGSLAGPVPATATGDPIDGPSTIDGEPVDGPSTIDGEPVDGPSTIDDGWIDGASTNYGDPIDDAFPADRSNASNASTPPDTAQAIPRTPPDPDEDVLGWENGIWYNESIDVDQAGGLSDAELDRFVARTMARVERIRQLEFRRNVTIEFVSRNEMREIAKNRTFGSTTNDQVWEALFFVGEDREARSVYGRYIGERVVGFAAEERSEELVLVTADPERPRTDEVVLAHELMHVLQHQHFDLYQPKYDPPTLDGEFGKDGVVEGEATYVHERYREQCAGAWDCVPTPLGWADTGRFSGSAFPHLFYQPYSDGAVFVHVLVQTEGWDAVAAAHESLPASSEQIIHRNDEAPAPIDVEDVASGGWEVVELGESGAERLGEAAIYELFREQARRHDVPELEGAFGADRDGPYDGYDYTSRPSAGWGNDRLLVYRHTAGDGAESGYVWKTVWDTERDAREFARAYRAVLEANGAVQQSPGVWLIDDGPYADAFRVVRRGDVVTIVNGPTTDALEQLRPREADGPVTPTETTSGTPTDGRSTSTSTSTISSDPSVETTGGPGTSPTAGGGTPGFGIAVALAAIAIVVGSMALLRRRA
jgi:hypothetical protein